MRAMRRWTEKLHVNATIVRPALAAAIEEGVAPFSLPAKVGPFFDDLRTAPEIKRMLVELYGK